MAIKPLTLDEVTYEEYCAALASISGQEVAFSLPGVLMKWVEEAQNLFKEIADEIGASLMDVVSLFRQKDTFALLKACGFSLAKILKAIAKLPSLITKGLLVVMGEIAQSGVIEKIRNGTMKVDELLHKYPVLRYLSGIAIAGLLIYMWLNMSFIGDFHYDFNMSDILEALKGNFSLHDLFLSDSGLALLALFALGTFTGIGVAWLGSSALNVLVAMLYTAAVRAHKSGFINSLKSMIERKRYAI